MTAKAPKIERRVLDKDLPLAERKRKLAPILDSHNLDIGQSSDALIKMAESLVPKEEQGTWHFTWDEDKPVAIKIKKSMGYEPAKDEKGKQFEFKGDLMWKIKDDVYQNRLLKTAYEGVQVADESLEDDGDTKGEDEPK